MSFRGMKRLSAQTLGPDDRVADAVRQGKPAVLKVVDPDVGWVHKLHDASPDTVLVGRIVDDSVRHKLTAQEGRAFAERVLQKANELGGVIRWWEGSNEAASGPEPIQRLCEFERAFAERIQAEGYHALVGGFSTGVPQIVGPNTEVPWLGEWELFYPAMRVAHGVHFREYWHPYQLNDTWNAYRFEKWWPALPAWAKAKWWLVGELGVDGGLAHEGRRGWSHYMPAALYLDMLKRYTETMAPVSSPGGYHLHRRPWRRLVVGHLRHRWRGAGPHQCPVGRCAGGKVGYPGGGGAGGGGARRGRRRSSNGPPRRPRRTQSDRQTPCPRGYSGIHRPPQPG